MEAHPHLPELDQLARARLRAAWLHGALVQLGFWVLDVAVVPELRWPFLGLRVLLVSAFALLVRAALRTPSPVRFRRLVLAAMLAQTSVVTTMTFFMGGFGAVYSYFAPLSIYSIAVLLPWTPAQGGRFLALSLAYYLAGNGLVLARGTGTWREALGGALFMGTACAFAFLTVVLSDRARRAELALRSDLTRANAALQATLAGLRERESRLASVGAMTSAIVHDLRNPLSAILSLSKSALEDARAAGGSPELVGDLASVVMSSRRLRAMLEELLAFARQGAAAPHDEAVAVPALLAESLAPHEAALRSAGVALVIDAAGAEGALVLADREALRRVLENLVRNAAEAIGLRPSPSPAAASPGAARGTVRVAAAAGEAEVAIVVEDDGCGIPEAVRATLFQPFATSGKPHGTGLGLMLARQVARNHGGDLTAEPPPPGGGAAFRLTLPRLRAG